MYNTDHVMAGTKPFSSHGQKKDSIFLWRFDAGLDKNIKSLFVVVQTPLEQDRSSVRKRFLGCGTGGF